MGKEGAGDLLLEGCTKASAMDDDSPSWNGKRLLLEFVGDVGRLAVHSGKPVSATRVGIRPRRVPRRRSKNLRKAATKVSGAVALARRLHRHTGICTGTQAHRHAGTCTRTQSLPVDLQPLPSGGRHPHKEPTAVPARCNLGARVG